MSASPQQDRRRLARTSPMDRHFDKQPTEFKARFRQRQDLQAQQDCLCAQLRKLYEDVRVVERGIAEIEKKLEDL